MGLLLGCGFFVGKVAGFDVSALAFCLVLLTLGSSAPSKGLEALRVRGSDSLWLGIVTGGFLVPNLVMVILGGVAEGAFGKNGVFKWPFRLD